MDTNLELSKLLEMKIDLEEKIGELIAWENNFNFRLWMKSEEQYSRENFLNYMREVQVDEEKEDLEDECSDVSVWLRCVRPAYIGPAYIFNKYIDVFVKDVFWNDIKYEIAEENWVSSSLREAEVLVELQNCLVSIKIGLDRMIKLFSLYYRGISPTSTFGRIEVREDGTEKGKNFMAYVLANKGKDEIFEFIYKEYNEWIRECVRPRDAIVHYQDFFSTYMFDSMTGTEYPVHFNEKNNEPIEALIFLVRDYVNRYYVFFEEILKAFFKKEKK